MKRYIPPALILLGFLTINAHLFIAQDLPAKKSQEITQKTEKQEQKKEGQKESPQPPIRSAEDVTWRDILELTQRMFDKSIGQSNLVIATMGGISGLIAVIMIIFSFFGIRSINAIRDEINNKKREIETCHEEIKKTQMEIEGRSKKINNLINSIEKSYQEIQKKSRQLSRILIAQGISPEIKGELSNFVRATNLAEAIGTQLNANDYVIRGNDFLSDELYEDAIKEFDKAILLEPNHHVAWNNKASALEDLGRHEDAINAIKKAIELKLDSPESWFCIGVSLGNLGRNKEAIDAIEKSINLKPDFSEAWLRRAVIFLRIGERDEALKSLKRATELDPSNKASAQDNKDFVSLWDDPEFKKLVAK
jgi:uncharacterized membrane-anchored protein YhcB (DUF1043 family)